MAPTVLTKWRTWWTLRRIRGALLVGGLVLLVLGAWLLVEAERQPTLDDQAVWFTAIAAGVALIALLAAGAAVYFALPSYHEAFVAKPDPVVRFQFQDGDGRWRDVELDSTTVLPHRGFVTRVRVHNNGNAVLRWGILNIQVPIDCQIFPADDRPGRVHFPAPTPFDSGELYPGETVPCNATVGERDFPPVHDFLYVVKVVPPDAGRWPLAAILDGYPYVREWTRVYVEVPAEG